MATARELITSALRLCRVKQKGNTPDADELSDGLDSLNNMLDSWQNERLMLYKIRELSHSLTSGTAKYYIGNGGDVMEDTGTATAGGANTITLASGSSSESGKWNGYQIITTSGTGSGQRKTINDYNGSSLVATVDSDWSTTPDSTTIYSIESKRPIRIETAFTRDANGLDVGIGMIDNNQWSRISMKSTSSTYPDFLYYRPDFKRGEINLYPKPGSGLTLYLEVWDSLTPFTTLDMEASLPPGFLRAITYNLAVEISPEYGVALPQSVYQIAIDAKSDIKRVNLDVPTLQNDLPLLSGSHYGGFRQWFFSGG